jgi:hypothetical protein
MSIIWDEDPDLPLNKLIKEIWVSNSLNPDNPIPQNFINELRTIFEMGFEEGQGFVYKLRSGKFDHNDVLEPSCEITLTNQYEDEKKDI